LVNSKKQLAIGIQPALGLGGVLSQHPSQPGCKNKEGRRRKENQNRKTNPSLNGADFKGLSKMSQISTTTGCTGLNSL
jgi:hypothetical protein